MRGKNRNGFKVLGFLSNPNVWRQGWDCRAVSLLAMTAFPHFPFTIYSMAVCQYGSIAVLLLKQT